MYSAELSTYNLKQTLDLVSKNFNEFVYCDTIQKLLDEIKQYDNCYWNPTLVKVGDNFYIAAINEALHNVISAELNDNPKTLFALSKHGVNIETYLLSTEAQKFASSHSYNIDIDEIDILINFLHDLSINKVAIEGVALYRDSLYKEILNKFKQNDIEVISNSNNDYEMPSAPVLISFRNSHIIYNPGKASKIVLIKNSRPVHVK